MRTRPCDDDPAPSVCRKVSTARPPIARRFVILSAAKDLGVGRAPTPRSFAALRMTNRRAIGGLAVLTLRHTEGAGSSSQGRVLIAHQLEQVAVRVAAIWTDAGRTG